MDNLWVDTLAQIDGEGHQLGSRVGQSSEIIGFSAKLESVRQTFLFNKIRKLSPYYACAEFLWYLSMTDDTSFLQLFAPSYKRFTEDGIHAFGAYGHRWKANARISQGGVITDQLTNVIETLKLHPESRQVIMTMWDGSDLYYAKTLDKKDLPCTLTHQFLLRNGYLHLVTNMRSNDAWLGLPYDVFCNTQLLKLISDIIDVAPGSYTHNAGSMHYYERDFEKIDSILSVTKEDVEAPFSEHRPGTSSLGFKEQVKIVIEFASSCYKDYVPINGIPLNEIDEILTLHSVLGDAAFVCASKVHKKLVNYIYDPQLRKAVNE